MTDHFARPERAATSREERVAELHRLCDADYASTAARRKADLSQPLYGSAAMVVREQLREPTDLQVAVEVARHVLDCDSSLTLREALRLLLRALDVHAATPLPAEAPPALRCPAATASDTSPCGGPVAVLVLGLGEGGTAGCEHHAARLIAAAPGTYPVALPHAPEGAATRVHRAAGEAGRR
ncbi:hypothetical protein ACGF3J_37440 [Streptomyces sp. NPDC048171]|uniref:hypothetical protein n=1 Tax=Streptomyces sp. NPDC048171 TaxID=3365504 RepID=UPI00371CCA8D